VNNDVEMVEEKKPESSAGVDEGKLFGFCMSVFRLDFDSHLLQVLDRPVCMLRAAS
jgi:hypothetical protein